MDEPCSALDPRSTLQIEELMAELKRDYTIVIVTHNMQQAARASDVTVFMTMAHRPRRLRRRAGRDDRDLHQPAEPADRGLRLRSVRLRTQRHARRHRRRPGAPPWTPSSTRSSHDAQPRAGPSPALQAPRDALDREESLIKDAVLRMGTLVEDAIRTASRSLQAHDAALALEVIKGDAIINEAQRAVSRLISVTIATQQPGRPRPALPADARPRHLRARAHRRPRLVRRQAGHQARPGAAARRVRPPARDGRAVPPSSSTASCGRSSTSDAVRGPRDRRPGRRDRPALPRDIRRGRRPDARRIRPTSSAGRGSSSRRTTWSGSATGRRTSPRTSSIS